MKYLELIDKYIEDKTKVFVNGMPDEEGGKILKKEDDFIVFEIINVAEKQENTTKEAIKIPINQIFSISEGEKKVSTLDSQPASAAPKK